MPTVRSLKRRGAVHAALLAALTLAGVAAAQRPATPQRLVLPPGLTPPPARPQTMARPQPLDLRMSDAYLQYDRQAPATMPAPFPPGTVAGHAVPQPLPGRLDLPPAVGYGTAETLPPAGGEVVYPNEPLPVEAYMAPEYADGVLDDTGGFLPSGYRPMAGVLSMEGATPLPRRLTPNTVLIDGIAVDRYPDRPDPVLIEGIHYQAIDGSDADSQGVGWSEELLYVTLPSSLLWQPPLANQRAPRFFAKTFNINDESTLGGENVIDTAIGGTFGLFRKTPPGKAFEGVQLDVFAAVFSRFNGNRLLTETDYRVGAPLTYAKGPWQAKFAYEHTSTHIGDEYAEANGRRQEAHVRDEFVFGLARRWNNELRLYGQFGYSFLTSDNIAGDDTRFDWGVEFSRQCPTGKRGQPFAAFDMDLRSDQDFAANTTVQVGWQWVTANRRSARIALEYYDGKSPYGQFFREDENWIGIAALYDW